MANINNSIFKQYLGTLDQFKSYYGKLTGEQKTALDAAIVFIHDKPVDSAWNHDGYIFANGLYYTCRNVDADTLSNLIFTGDASGVKVSVVTVDVKDAEGNVIGTTEQVDIVPVLKEDLVSTVTSAVGFIKNGHTWPKGTSLEKVLADIFSKEYWYKAEFNYSNLKTVTYVEPTLTVTVGGAAASNNATYEIGAPVSVSATMNASTIAGTNEVKVTPKTSGVKFSTIGNLDTALSEKTYSATYTEGTDALSVTSKSGCFNSASVSNNAVSATGNIAASNSITITTTHSGSKLTLSTTSDVDNKLYTRSNKNNLKKDADGNVSTTATDINDASVTVEHTVATANAVSPTGDNTNSITLKGAYKYYYVWGSATEPTIPESFTGKLTDWTDAWSTGLSTINAGEANAKAIGTGKFIYVLKPSSASGTKGNISLTDSAKNQVGGTFALIKTINNGFDTEYKLYRYPEDDGGAGTALYYDLKLN
jgi:hypothetical protein